MNPPEPVPLYTSYLVGWRGWNVYHRYLCSFNGRDLWLPRKPLKSGCLKINMRPLTDSVPPDPNCSCGIYAYKSPAGLGGDNAAQVVGKVALWGTGMEAEAGWRMQFAYPLELWVLPRDRYGKGYGGGSSFPLRLLDYGVPVHYGTPPEVQAIIDENARKRAEATVAAAFNSLVSPPIVRKKPPLWRFLRR